MGKHTDGPWVASEDGFGSWSVTVAKNKPGTNPIFDLYEICDRINGDSRDEATDGRPSDNARLIAAAPELLDALRMARRCLTWYADKYESVNKVDADTQAAMDAAIARATGSQP